MPSTRTADRKSPLDHEPAAVRYARKNVDLTLEQAAEFLGFKSVGSLSDIERGRRNANLALMRKMAALYRCPLIVLMARQPEMADAS